MQRGHGRDKGRVDIEDEQTVSTVSIVPATYIQVAGGLNLAAVKKFNVAGSVNLATMCGMKNNPQIRRSTTTPLLMSNECARPAMMIPRCRRRLIQRLRHCETLAEPAASR